MHWSANTLADSATWGVIVGVVLPWLTAIVQQPRWSGTVRRGIAVAAAVVAGVLTCLANGSLSQGQTLLATIAAVLVASQAAYTGLWKGGIATMIERATSPKAASPSPPRAL